MCHKETEHVITKIRQRICFDLTPALKRDFLCTRLSCGAGVRSIGAVRKTTATLATKVQILATAPMANLFQNPLFWPNQADFAVDQSKPNIFIGCGIATKNKISQAVPLDILGFLLTAEFIKRQIPNSKVFLLIADQHAWLANNFDRGECQKETDKLHTAIKKIINNLRLNNWQLFLASQVFPDALPQSYEQLESRDVTHFFNNHNCGIKIGWSFSTAETNHKTDEAHFDSTLNLPINILLTKPGVTSDPNKPLESPYICVNPAARITLGKLSTLEVESNPAVKKHLKRIMILWENLFGPFPNKTPLESKINQVLEKIIC